MEEDRIQQIFAERDCKMYCDEKGKCCINFKRVSDSIFGFCEKITIDEQSSAFDEKVFFLYCFWDRFCRWQN